ncbi:hypothetical protein [Maribacter hydrothermalis]|uniref:Secreted protein n=1 Tax=Maribacter hydrothermalis TaxID=1836467 RepID=A0A1B7Z8D7_9FLAO|nr:hypothetical protein [Maribacter hydrothermalis]APQ19035.1 hypothetical protein BTR34_17660 [Maribacter hydrothermalis]OBR38952.1 hypothetical protein A9200_04615 [Maribacter hydrothermalis]
MTLKHTISIITFLFALPLIAQEPDPSEAFWNRLQSHCGNAYEGNLALPEEDESFGGKKLVMHIKSCSDSEIKIPFFVGDDKSRTWIFTKNNGILTLKHDHRHEDGSEDNINFYGGTASNTGKANIQFFPADVATQKMIPGAATNVWWVTLDDKTFTYNLRRLGTDRVFKVVMDITKPISTPEDPWGWVD